MSRGNFAILILLASACTGTKQSEKYNIESLKIMYVNLQTSTLTRVDCDKYETLFSTPEKVVIIDNKDALKRVENYLGRLKKSTVQRDGIDTRIKVYIKYSDGTEKQLCVSRFHMLLDGQTVDYNIDLKDYILELIQIPIN